MQDQEIKTILDKREKHVCTLLITHKGSMIEVAELLLKKEVVYEEDFLRLLKQDKLS